ncbi:MAG: ATP-binding domain-containing protein [Cobetia sp.]|uniref:DEAD/DEAH box helicase n=1 Tax=Cobetia sp. TaxID=1873876 RepID=UPI003242D2F3
MDKVIASEISPGGIDEEMINFLETNSAKLSIENSILYYGFPVYKDYDGEIVKTKFLILSDRHGIILLQTSIADDIEKDNEHLNQSFSFIETSLKRSKLLRVNRRELAVNIDGYTFNSKVDVDNIPEELDGEVLSSYKDVEEVFYSNMTEDSLDQAIMHEARSIIEGSKALSSISKREKITDSSQNKLNILIGLESEVTNFDIEQRKIAINLINGPQRIRGLAGSGKTVVLAMKAAHIHLQYPDRKILFTFYTKSLYELIKESITRFYRHYSGEEPNWENVDILHAWGGKSIDGVYYNACVENTIQVMSFNAAKGLYPRDPFRAVCENLQHHTVESKYDHILIDEAQDLPNEFFHLCYKLAYGSEGKEKNIVWAYDDLQSIFNVYQRTPMQLFGNDGDGKALINLEEFQEDLAYGQINDLVLYKCYRNPLEVLITAHALGFGIYSERPVQMLENESHWKDVGYDLAPDQVFEIGSRVEITRDRSNSPLSIYKYQEPRDIIAYYKADNLEHECQWICSNILESISSGLKPQDILVICLDDRNAKSYFSNLSVMLIENGIRSNNLLTSTASAPAFKINDMVTLSTVHRAKGNEAAEVYAAGIDAIYYERNNRSGRNKLFTAFTRTKAWLKISGINQEAEFFFKEIDMSVANSPSLIFDVPDAKEIETIQRDLQERSVGSRNIDIMVQELIDMGVPESEIKENLGNIKKGR